MTGVDCEASEGVAEAGDEGVVILFARNVRVGGVIAAIGRREQDNSIDYTGYDIGLNYALTRNLEAELRWYGTDADVPGEQYADSLVAGVSFAF